MSVSSVALTPMYPFAVSAGSLQSPPKNKALEKEEAVKPMFDFEPLSAAIFAQLLEEDGDVNDAANALIQNNPDILVEFSSYRPSIVKKAFKEYLINTAYKDRDSICKTAEYLCIISILNSKQPMIVNLEGNMVYNLWASRKERVQSLISVTEELIALAFVKDIVGLERYSIKLNQMEAELAQTLALFCYLNDDYREVIEVLVLNTTQAGGSPRYPKCKKDFKEFWQNLSILGNEKLKLSQLLGRIHQKQVSLRSQMGQLYQVQEQKEAKKMIPLRESFFKTHESEIWKEGEKLFKAVFKETLVPKNLRADFSRALAQAGGVSQDSDISSIWNVWELYAGTPHLFDLGDFMRHFINVLSEKRFQQLVSKEKTLEKTFFEFFGQKATFSTLKKWAKSQKPLV